MQNHGRHMSVQLDPDLQKRLKVCAANLGIRTSALFERIIRDGIGNEEFWLKWPQERPRLIKSEPVARDEEKTDWDALPPDARDGMADVS